LAAQLQVHPSATWWITVIKKGFFATYSNASIIKVTLTMILDLLPHEGRPAVLWDQAGVMDVVLLLVMYGGASMNRRGPAGSC
jgi:hypothetical protein